MDIIKRKTTGGIVQKLKDIWAEGILKKEIKLEEQWRKKGEFLRNLPTSDEENENVIDNVPVPPPQPKEKKKCGKKQVGKKQIGKAKKLSPQQHHFPQHQYQQPQQHDGKKAWNSPGSSETHVENRFIKQGTQLIINYITIMCDTVVTEGSLVDSIIGFSC